MPVIRTEDQKSRSCPAKPRAVLTKSEVIAIFQSKLTHSPATKVARLYGVSEKAIRDIWTARTWAAETWHLDPSRALVVKTSGRPIGSRDSKPRKPRQASKDCFSPANSELASNSLGTNQSPTAIDDLRMVEDHESNQLKSFRSTSQPWHCQNTTAFNQYIEGRQQHKSEQILCWSLDEQLFAWEHSSDDEPLPDPFEADWSAFRRPQGRMLKAGVSLN